MWDTKSGVAVALCSIDSMEGPAESFLTCELSVVPPASGIFVVLKVEHGYNSHENEV